MQTDQNGQNRQSKLRRRLFGAAAALVCLWMLLLNVLTPYIADDFTFAYAFDTGLRLHSLPQLIKSLAYHYYEWSGRVVVKFFAQGFTMLPKFVFDLCNAAAYLGLGLVIYRLAAGRRRNHPGHGAGRRMRDHHKRAALPPGGSPAGHRAAVNAPPCFSRRDGI